MKFKILGFAMVLAVFCWFVWWWVAATAQETALNQWLNDRRENGWQAETADISIAGFPNRLDTTLNKPAIADPASGWAWNAPFLSVFQVIYDPTHFIIVWPNSQTIAAPGATATLNAETMRASVVFTPNSRLEVDRASLEIRGATLEGVEGWRASATSWIQHIRRTPDAGPENAYEFRADGVDIEPPADWRAILDPAGTLPDTMETVLIEGRVAFDRPLDRNALEGVKPNVIALTLKEMEASWGGLSLSVTGAVRADDQGYAEGQMTVNARKWQDMVDAAVAANMLTQTAGDAVKTGLGLIARLSGDKHEITAPLKFSGGFMRLGPVPIGNAPKLVK